MSGARCGTIYLFSKCKLILHAQSSKSLLVLQTVELQGCGLPYMVVCQQDELVVLGAWERDFKFGAIAGVEVKKQLTAEAVRQAKTEFLLSGCKSSYPFIQVGAKCIRRSRGPDSAFQFCR